MTLWLGGVALVVAAGAVVALTASEPRLALVGLAAALLGAALLADPLPAPAVLGVRLAAALLAVAALRAAAPPIGSGRGDAPERDGGPRLAWPALLLLGAAGGAAALSLLASLPEFVPVAVGGPGLTGLGHGAFLDASGVALVLGSGVASAALPAAVLETRDGRRAVAVLLVVEAVALLRVGLVGPPGVVEEIVLATLMVAAAAGVAILTAARGPVPGGARLP